MFVSTGLNIQKIQENTHHVYMQTMFYCNILLIPDMINLQQNYVTFERGDDAFFVLQIRGWLN